MKQQKFYSQRAVILLASFCLVLVSFTLSGCSVQPASELRDHVFKDLKALGFLFDDTLVWVDKSNDTEQVVISGPMIGPLEVNGPKALYGRWKTQDNFGRYQEVRMVLNTGTWKFEEGKLRL